MRTCPRCHTPVEQTSIVGVIPRRHEDHECIEVLEAQRDELYRALEAVEWTGGAGSDWGPTCPDCGQDAPLNKGDPPRKHHDGCVIAAALRKARGESTWDPGMRGQQPAHTQTTTADVKPVGNKPCEVCGGYGIPSLGRLYRCQRCGAGGDID